MFISHPIISLILFAVVAFGASKVFRFISHHCNRLMPSIGERRVKHIAWTVVGRSLALMAAPLLIPFGGPVRTMIMLIYVVYVSVSLWSVYTGYFGRDNTESK